MWELPREEENPRGEERVTGLEQTAARSMSVVRGNTFPSVLRVFSDPSKTKPLTHEQMAVPVQPGHRARAALLMGTDVSLWP